MVWKQYRLIFDKKSLFKVLKTFPNLPKVFQETLNIFPIIIWKKNHLIVDKNSFFKALKNFPNLPNILKFCNFEFDVGKNMGRSGHGGPFQIRRQIFFPTWGGLANGV